MTNLSPNFEIALFLCQTTGSILLTDNHYRWDEVLQAQYREKGFAVYSWNNLFSIINEFEYSLNRNPEITFQLRATGKLGKIRKALKDVYQAIRNDSDPEKIDFLTESLKKQYEEAYNTAEREFDNNDQNTFKGKMHFLVPQGGIVHNNVQRMLVTCGNEHHLKSVPMAILVKHA